MISSVIAHKKLNTTGACYCDPTSDKLFSSFYVLQMYPAPFAPASPNNHPVSGSKLPTSSLPRAWVVLLTSLSYLPGVVVLAHSLRRVQSKYPLIIAVTPSLPKEKVDFLDKLSLDVVVVEPLKPNVEVSIVADRFEDTWTKLAVFGFEGVEGFQKIVLLDADMMMMQNMDEIFDLDIPRDWIAANHACVCNLKKAPWAPDDWIPENCAYTPQRHPSALTGPVPVSPTSIRTHTLLNSGLVLLHPSKEVFEQMKNFLYNSPLVSTFSFPDQDFLAEFYKGRWKPIGWQYNAIKTGRYEHPEMWRDEEVRNLHFIVKKPWNTGRLKGGVDEVTHGWWWDEFERWKHEMAKNGENESVRVVMQYMSPEEI